MTAAGTTPRCGRRSPTGSPTRRRSATPGRRGPGRSSTSAPTPSPPTSWPRRRRAGQGRPVPLQRPRVPRVDVRRVQGRARRRQHQLPLHRRRADLPVGQRRRRRRRVPRRVRRAVRGRPRAAAAYPHVAVGRRRLRPCPAWATPYEAAAAPWPGRTAAPWGRSGDHLLLLYTGGTTGMPEGGDVAPGRPVPRPRPARAGAAARRRPMSTTSPPQLDRPGPSSLPGGTADARHRAVQRVDDAVDRRVDRHPAPAATSTRSSCSTPSSGERVKSMTIVGDAFGKPILRALDAEPEPLGHLVAARHHLVRRDVVEGDQGRPAAPQRAADPRRHAGIVGGDRHGHQRDDRRRRRRHRRRSGSPTTRG